MKIRNIFLVAIAIFTTTTLMAAETYKEAWAKGVKEYKAKKYKESAVTFAEAAKLAKTPEEKYSSMCYQGYSLRSLRKYDEVIKVFEDLMKVEKLNAGLKNKAFSQYLHSLYYAKKYKEVLKMTEKTLMDDNASNSMKTICAYLSCLSSNTLIKYSDMEKWAKKMRELNPKGLWNNRGLIYQAQALRYQKKYKEAEKLLDKDIIVKMHPHRQGEAYLERGYVKGSLGKHEKAVVEFVAVYEIPKGYVGHKEVAIVYAIERLKSTGKLEAADVWIERVDTIKNKYWKARGLWNASQILQKQGKLEEAEKKLTECKKSGPWYKKASLK